MIVAIVSAVLAFVPAILIGKNIAVGWGILCYFLSLVAGILGFYIGKILNEFVGDRFIITNGGFLDLVTEKFNALYGPQISGFLIGLFIPAILINAGIEKNEKYSANKEAKVAIEEEIQDQLEEVKMVAIRGGEFNFAPDNSPTAYQFRTNYSELKLSVGNFAIAKELVSEGLYGKIMNSSFVNGIKPYDYFTFYKAIVFCNKLSEYHNLTPCYSIKGSTNTEDWGEIPSGNTGNFAWDSVKCDFSVNGYRLPTVAEWCYAMYGSTPNGLLSLYGDNGWEEMPNYWDLTVSQSQEELLWNWYSKDCSYYAKEISEFGERRTCGSMSSFNGISGGFSISDSGGMSFLRLVRTISTKELEELVSRRKQFDVADYGMKMIFVEGGEFECGGEKNNQVPKHTAKVNDFYMSTTMVTCDLFSPDDYSEHKSQQVAQLPLLKAIQCCNYLSIKSGFSPCYIFPAEEEPFSVVKGFEKVIFDEHANGYRLPTEEEWEYAARGGKNHDNYRWSGSDDIEEVAWYSGNSNENSYDIVGLKKPNSLGIYDMSGLADEWVWSHFETGKAIHSSDENNTYSQSRPNAFVLRGGNKGKNYNEFDVFTRRIDKMGALGNKFENSSYGAIRLVRNK